jgi:hypothetical protein
VSRFRPSWWQESDWSKLPSARRITLALRIFFILGVGLLLFLVFKIPSDWRVRLFVTALAIANIMRATLAAYSLGRKRQMEESPQGIRESEEP